MSHLDHHPRGVCPRSSQRSRRLSLRGGRLASHPILLGILALAWLILQTGRKPSRITYPCQQAALGSVWLVIGLPLAPLLRTLVGRKARRVHFAALLGVLAILGLGGFSDTRYDRRARDGASVPAAPAGYVADIYVVENAGGPRGDHHLGIDQLIACLGGNGLKFYRSEAGGPESGPDGLIGSDDVVLVKINQQWGARGGTNTDVLKGLIARIVEHPDGFSGEVVVVENTQGQGTLDWSMSNAEDIGQSALDVVNHFANQARPVSAVLWDEFRQTSVAEYADGDANDGYVVGPYLPETQIRVSYPKFRTAGGTYVSLARGIWNPGLGTYEDARLRFLNVPVLKSHGAVYGVTASVKNHVGTMTTGLGTNTHFAVRHGGLGSFLSQVRMPDLNILDCIYVLARPDRGPPCPYADATRLGKLVASLDPVALDLWATANILVPAMIANGYTEYPKQDPDDPASDFRTYLDAATRELLAAGIVVTNDPARITAHSCPGIAGSPEAGASEGNIGAFPNPFEARATIRFAPRISGTVRLDIYDVGGRVRRIFRESVRAGIPHEIQWDGRDAEGRMLPPGTYYYRLSGAGEPRSGKLILAR